MMLLLAVFCAGADARPAGTATGRPGAAAVVETRSKPAQAESRASAAPGASAQPRALTGPPLLPISGFAEARITPNLCLYRYPVGTTVPACQEHIDQGLGYFYSYVWIEAVRSFETATRLDPDCAMAWWWRRKARRAAPWRSVPRGAWTCSIAFEPDTPKKSGPSSTSISFDNGKKDKKDDED